MEAELVYLKFDNMCDFVEGHVPLKFTQKLRVIRGISGAVSFGWRECQGPVSKGDTVPNEISFILEPFGLDVGYHRLERTAQWQHETRDCLALGTASDVSCFGDGSSLRATQWLEEWLTVDKDEDWMRDRLNAYYHATFHPEDRPRVPDEMELSEVLHALNQTLEGF